MNMKSKFSINLRVQRFTANPLISFASSPTLGNNINGPSVVRVPHWLPAPLGQYYMYFAHHSGAYIRLAYADDLQGPWRIYEPGTLHLKDALTFCGHLASPDVHVDDQEKLIRMYFHGLAKHKEGQCTGVATSKDGLHFNAFPTTLGKFYFRVWQWQDQWYAIAKNNNEGWGELYRAQSPMGPFELRGNFLQRMRHAAIFLDGNILRIFYSRVEDAPERILMTSIDMNEDWLTWTPSEPPIEVLRPELIYEGSQYPVNPSKNGSSIGVNEIRDPFVLATDKEDLTIFYSVAGETAICDAMLKM